MPKKKAADQDEIPTEPDLRFTTCPACKGDGWVLKPLETPGFRHRSVRGPCDWCFGQKRVDRARHEQWHAEGRGNT